MSIHQLPPELIEKIGGELTWPSLSSFSLTSRGFHAICAPYLRRDVVLLSSDGRTLHPQALDAAAALARADGVTVISPTPAETVQKFHRGRCPSCDLADSKKEAEVGGRLIHEVLGHCQPDRLRRFTWLLGVCVQMDVLGYRGLLATTQRRLEELHLITCYFRLGLRCLTRSLDLTPFAHLRALTWTGLDRSQIPVLERALESCAPRLEALSLDYLSHNQPMHGDPSLQHRGYLLDLVLSLRGPNSDSAFPRLRSLSLTNAEIFAPDYESVRRALNVPELAELELKQCTGWEELLPNAAPRLRRLEVHSRSWGERDLLVTERLGRFLERCAGLRTLSLYRTKNVPPGVSLGLPFLSFQAPGVRRAVFHEGSPQRSARLPREGTRWEVTGYEPAGNPLSHLRLEFLGYAAPPWQMKLILDEMTLPEALSNLRVLHVRQDHEKVSTFCSDSVGYARPDPDATRPDLARMLTPDAFDLATWAFTTSKLPSLGLVAFGDFGSFNPRARLLLHRTASSDDHLRPPSSPFELVTEADRCAVELLYEYLDSVLVGPTYSKPTLGSPGANLRENAWRTGLAVRIARENGARAGTVRGAEDGMEGGTGGWMEGVVDRWGPLSDGDSGDGDSDLGSGLFD